MKGNKIFQESEQFPSLLLKQTIKTSKINKINIVKEKKLRNKIDAREEH